MLKSSLRVNITTGSRLLRQSTPVRFHSTQMKKSTEIKAKDLPHLPPSTPLRSTKYLKDSFPSIESVKPEELALHSEQGSIESKPPSWYFVGRTRSNKLPVYLDYKLSGKITTIIRRVQGNISQLRNDLLVELQVPKKDVVVKDASKQIAIRGDYSNQVKEVLSKYF